jgi:hypothetical protein
MAYDHKQLTFYELKQRRETSNLYEWDDNSFYLYWKVVNDTIPDDPILRKQYLFDRCQNLSEETFLMNIYQRWFEYVHREIPIFRKLAVIHEAFCKDQLVIVLIMLFQDHPEYLESIRDWNDQHPHIFLSQL